MSLPVAVLEPVGANVAGQQPQGIVQQYQKAGTASAVDTSTGIHPYDSGTILGTVPPGKPGLKLVDGTVQRAAQIVSTQAAGSTGNALTATSGVGLIPTPPAGSQPADGLSQAPNHE